MEKSVSAKFENECLRLLKYANELADAIAVNAPLGDVLKIKNKIDELRSAIKLSYSTKFEGAVYGKRINAVKAVISGNKENIVIENFAKKLAKVVDIMSSNKGDYVKLQALTDIYESHTELLKDYCDLIPELLYTPFITKLSEATNLLKANSRNMADVVYDKKLAKFNETYDYARFIVHEYFNFENEDKSKFLKKYGITEDDFNYCIKVIQNLDVDLYNQYLMIENLRNIDRIRDVINSIDYIYESIKFEEEDNKLFNDINSSDSKWVSKSIREASFNDIDFLKANQFKDSKSFSVEFPKKAKKYVTMASQSIVDLDERNAFIEKYFDRVDAIKTYMSTNPNTITRHLKDISVDESELKGYLKHQNILVSRSEIDIVLAYMRSNNLPMTAAVFNFVANEYLNYRLDLTNITLEDYEQKNKEQCLIIPSSYERKKR